MPHENPPRSDHFWMADPLSILVQTVLTKSFNLEDAEAAVANEHVLQYIESLSRCKTLEESGVFMNEKVRSSRPVENLQRT
jgi:hypothetical protein